MQHNKKTRLTSAVSVLLLLFVITGAVYLGAGVGFGQLEPPVIYIHGEGDTGRIGLTDTDDTADPRTNGDSTGGIDAAAYNELKNHIIIMEELLDNGNFYDLTQDQIDEYMLEMPEVIRNNYGGLGRIENESGYLLLTCREGGTPLPKGCSTYEFGPAHTEKTQLVMEDAEGIEICRFPLGMKVRYFRDVDIFFVVAGDDSESVRLISRIAGYQLAGNGDYIEYARQARSRGTSLFRPESYPYIAAFIMIDGKERTEYIPMDDSLANEFKDSLGSLTPVQYDTKRLVHTGISVELGKEYREQYNLCILDDGTRAFHRYGDFNTVYVDGQLISRIIEMVASRTLWEWVELSEIHDIVKAEMRIKLHRDLPEETQIIEDPDKLRELEALFKGAEYCGVAGCPYTGLLTLTRADGKVIRVQVATDSCDTMILGTSGGYDYGPGYVSDSANNKQSILVGIFGEITWTR
jgi:hypothetical protein